MEEILVIPKFLENEKYDELLDKYFSDPGRSLPSFNRKMYKLTGKYPSNELVKDLTHQAEMVTNDTVKEFNDRFTYITTYKDGIYTVNSPNSSKGHINYRPCCNIENCIGREVFGTNNGRSISIYDNNNKCVA